MRYGIVVRNLCLILLLLLGTSACRCWFFCYDDTSMQRNYVADRDDCQDDAEMSVGYLSGFYMNEKERNGRLLQEFANCMRKKNWGVSKPKINKEDEEIAVAQPVGIPPGDDYTTKRSATNQQQVVERNNQTRVETNNNNTVVRETTNQQRSSVNRQQNIYAEQPQQQQQQPIINNYYYQVPPQQQQPQQQQVAPVMQQAPPPRVIERQIIREVPARAQPAPPPQIIRQQTQVIREVPVQAPPQVIRERTQVIREVPSGRPAANNNNY